MLKEKNYKLNKLSSKMKKISKNYLNKQNYMNQE